MTTSTLLPPPDRAKRRPRCALVDLVEVAAQISVPTDLWLKSLSELAREVSDHDKFELVTRRSVFSVRVFRSWEPRRKGLKVELNCLGRLPGRVEGHALDLTGIAGALFYDRRTTITVTTDGASLYVGKYWVPIDQPNRANVADRGDQGVAILERIAILDERNLLDPPEHMAKVALRYERDQRLARLLKLARGFSCQICNASFEMTNGERYCECHHLEHLANGGLDISRNMLILCAQHHRQFHHGLVRIHAHSASEIIAEIDGVRYSCSLSIDVEKRLT